MTNESQSCLVLWSGGADSTLVLWDLLREKPGDTVRAFSVTHHHVHPEVEARDAREKIRKWLERKGLKFKHTEVGIHPHPDLHDFSASNGNGGVQHPVIWMGAVIPYLRETEDLYTGYIRKDDIWHHWESMRYAYTNLMSIAGKSGNLHTPLEWWDKAEVIKRLRKSRGLISRVW